MPALQLSTLTLRFLAGIKVALYIPCTSPCTDALLPLFLIAVLIIQHNTDARPPRPCPLSPIPMALALAPLSGQQSSAQLPSLNDLNYSQQHTSSSSYNPYQNQAYSVGPSSSSSSSAAPQYTMPREPKTHHGQHHDPYPVSYAQSQQMPPPPMHHLSQHHQQPQQGQQQQHPPQQQVNGYGQQNGPQHVQNGSASNHPSPIASPAIQTQPLSRPDSGPASPPESVSPQSPQAPNSQPNGAPSTSVASAPSASGGGKKKHVCPTCDRAFTTSGHLARHTRVHTGERNHKCPFPGCETRCSRQDNLQQQCVAILLVFWYHLV